MLLDYFKIKEGYDFFKCLEVLDEDYENLKDFSIDNLKIIIIDTMIEDKEIDYYYVRKGERITASEIQYEKNGFNILKIKDNYKNLNDLKNTIFYLRMAFQVYNFRFEVQYIKNDSLVIYINKDEEINYLIYDVEKWKNILKEKVIH